MHIQQKAVFAILVLQVHLIESSFLVRFFFFLYIYIPKGSETQNSHFTLAKLRKSYMYKVLSHIYSPLSQPSGRIEVLHPGALPLKYCM